ncbi:MAG: peroxiredoxin-like family protein [Zetaproteobacteria bacterium]|nr:MAG: peroxiredoxin-like family protein [Zetaproteobacteria bacterium]
MSLRDQIEKLKQDMSGQTPPDVQQAMQQAAEVLKQSGISDHSLKAGDAVPDFTLPDAKGGNVHLAGALTQGPVVLSFYRGGWCPYCNLELQALQQALPEIQELGAQLVAVSPELPDQTLSTTEKHALAFAVCSDTGNRVARDFGIVFTLPEILRPIYAKFGIDLPAWNGDGSFELPVPATYVLDRNGIILDGFVNTDYMQRMEPERIIDILRNN